VEAQVEETERMMRNKEKVKEVRNVTGRGVGHDIGGSGGEEHLVGDDRWERGNGKKVGQNGTEWKTHGGSGKWRESEM
jgi:hypothetical protein